MNVKNKGLLILLGAGFAFTFGNANADPFVGKSSNESYVKVGDSDFTGGPHTAGFAGISVNSTGIDTQIDFQGLTGYSTQTTPSVDWNQDGTSDGTQTVYQLSFPYSGAPSSHDSLGVFAFVQAGDLDVWAGEWYSKKTDDEGLATHTVYYIGDNADTSITSSGTATYNVAGINNYSGSNLLSGTFTANFTNSTLTGSISNSSGYSVDIGTAAINSDASISGTSAVASQSGVPVDVGSVSGQFYSSQAALAGYAVFTNNQYDTSFVGVKN